MDIFTHAANQILKAKPWEYMSQYYNPHRTLNVYNPSSPDVFRVTRVRNILTN